MFFTKIHSSIALLILILFDSMHFSSDTMWSIVQVTESGTLALTQQLSELRTNNAADVSVSKPALEVKLFHHQFFYLQC